MNTQEKAKTAKEIINILYRHSVVSLIDEQQILTIGEKQLSKIVKDLTEILNARKEADKIIDIVLKYYQFSKTDVDNTINKTRNSIVVECRVVISYFLLSLTKLTLQEIANIFGVDHSTVIHYKKKFEDWYETDKEFRQRVDKIKEELNNN